jgi:hypothetical protein
MPREPKSLLTASRLRVGEDRLTDIVAVAARRCRPFALGLLEFAGRRPERVTRVRALTQPWTPRGRRLDLELVAYADDRVVSRVWCENKLEALYQPTQLEDYSKDLATMPDEDVALLTIVTRFAQAPPGAWSIATWSDVGALAARVLRENLGLHWHRDVWELDISAGFLVLAELVEYLRDRFQVVTEPLTTTNVLVFANAAQAYETLEALLERAAKLCGEPVTDPPDWSYNGSSAWIGFDQQDGDWWTSYDGYPEIHLANSDDYFGSERRGEPAFGLGVTLPAGYGETIFSERTGWIAQLRALGCDPAPDDECLRIYRSVYLPEVLSAGVTLERQAGHVAKRLNEALQDLRQTPPDGPLTLPPKRAAKGRPVAGRDEPPVAQSEPPAPA